MTEPIDDEIVYGMAGGDLVLIPRTAAERLAALQDTIRSAATWGEARRQLPVQLFRELLEQCSDDLEGDPAADEVFDADTVPGYADGDWPEWPKQLMLDWIPKRVQREFGLGEASVLNGDFLQLDTGRARELVAAMEAGGYSCRRDDALVARASGY